MFFCNLLIGIIGQNLIFRYISWHSFIG